MAWSKNHGENVRILLVTLARNKLNDHILYLIHRPRRLCCRPKDYSALPMELSNSNVRKNYGNLAPSKELRNCLPA
ncbi:unnamed protein product [Allacma fusca]|uniref:Uncharacterized protein n=1 Tax=Allacma fusca TaxID=39272 RepID=A0A8J2J757_9HEXA|nr:unnamed protein product [Allacma fusca]